MVSKNISYLELFTKTCAQWMDLLFFNDQSWKKMACESYITIAQLIIYWPKKRTVFYIKWLINQIIHVIDPFTY